MSSKGQYKLLQKANEELSKDLILIATWQKRIDHPEFESYNCIEISDDDCLCEIMHNSKCDDSEPSL